MTISALDVADVRPASVLPPAAEAVLPPAAEEVVERAPAAVLAAAAVGGLEAVALVAAALAGLDGLLTSSARPPAIAVGAGLVVLATWTVLCAAGGAFLLEGSGRRTLTGVAYGELALVAALLVASQVTPLLDVLPAGVSAPALALLLLAVPVGKLLLASSPSTAAWVAAGPWPREHRPDPATAHRRLCAATLAVIGITLTAVALLVPAPGAGHVPPASAVSSH